MRIPTQLLPHLLRLALPFVALPALAQPEDLEASAPLTSDYTIRYLVSDGSGPGHFTDANLVNAWGIVFNPNGFVWVSDNGTGLSTLYDGTGKAQSLVVQIPPAPQSGETQGKPTGIVFNSSTDFVVKQGDKSGPGVFLFASEDGGISGWAPSVDPTHALIAVDGSGRKAIYKGLATAGNGRGHLLYATDFHNRRVDVFNAQFKRVQVKGGFRDAGIPSQFAPFGIQAINGNLYVSYAKQDDEGEDDVPGAGLGFVDVFNADGELIQRFASRGALNAPWGLALAPRSFGRFGGALLVANFGDGTINAFELRSGKWLGALLNSEGHRIRIDGLWGLSFGNGVFSQPADALFFTAGPQDEEHGAYGVIRVAHAQP